MNIFDQQNRRDCFRKVARIALYGTIGLILIACDRDRIANALDGVSTESSTAPAIITPTQAIENKEATVTPSSVIGDAVKGIAKTTTDLAETPTVVPTNPPPTPVPTNPLPTPEPLTFNLVETTLTSESALYVSPNSDDLVVPVTIPAGEKIYVWGTNNTQSWLRILWNAGIGWVPVSATDYNGRQEKLSPLPILRDPPGCAYLLTTQFGLNNEWVSDDMVRVAVVVDLFRADFGSFPLSSMSLTVNGQEVETSRRELKEQGQFLLKDVVFSLPDDLQPGDTLGYHFATSSKEPFTFMATLFGVPEGCQFKQQ